MNKKFLFLCYIYFFSTWFTSHILIVKKPGVNHGCRQYNVPRMTRSFPDFLSGSLKYVFWWPADRSQDDEWYRNNDRSNDGKPWPIAGAPARVLYCTLSPIHHLPTLAMVQSEVINGFFIRLVKSFYIKPRMAARMHDMTRTMHLLLSLPIDDHSFSSPRPSARGSSSSICLLAGE